MKKKMASMFLSLILIFLLTGCNAQNNYKGDLELNVSSADASITVGQEYRLKYTVTVGTATVTIEGKDGNTDVTQFARYIAATKTFTASKKGVYTLSINATYKDAKKSGMVTISVTDIADESQEEKALMYPQNPNFNNLQARPSDYTSWTEFGAHDPSLIQVDGMYYAFSTDVAATQNGYQIRSSYDGIHWQYVGSAFAPKDITGVANMSSNGMMNHIYKKYGNTHEDTCISKTTGEITFWAPDVVLGADGMFWLYYCVTSNFGSNVSYLGLAKAYNVTGPYKHYATIYESNLASGVNAEPEAVSGTINGLDPQIIYEENDSSKDMYMAFGSFFNGIGIMKLDKLTGKADKAYNDGVGYKKLSSGNSFGGEGSVITYNKVREYNSEGGYAEKGYYYMFVSMGNLSTTYNMRCLRSETIDGEYTGYNASQLSGSGANNLTGNKVSGSFRFNYLDPLATTQPADFYAPGHNDLFTTDNGTNLVAYHCRCEKVGENMHYLYTSQYFFNQDGHLVMNPNRFAGDGEKLRSLTVNEILGVEGELKDLLAQQNYSKGVYKMVMLDYKNIETVQSVTVSLTDTLVDGLADTYKIVKDGQDYGTWQLNGGEDDRYYITIVIGAETYKGVAVPSFLTDQSLSGISITALSTTDGDAIYFNMGII